MIGILPEYYGNIMGMFLEIVGGLTSNKQQ